MAWAWFLLSQAPDAAARLQAEAAAALAGRAAGFADLPALPFTRAVVEETLRLYPPILLLARVADHDIEIGGHQLRRGGIVMEVPWLLHRHRALWPQPDHFVPERFLPNGDFLGAPIPRGAFIPFGLGPRVHRRAIRPGRGGDLPGDAGPALRPAAGAGRPGVPGLPADAAAGRNPADAAGPPGVRRAALANGLERALHQPLRLLPTPVVMAIGRALGRRVAPALYPVQDRLARAAFRHLRPDLPLEPAMAAMWRNLACTFAEMPRFLRFWDEGRIEVSGAEHLLETRRHRPVLLAGLHLGNPEVLGLALARLGARPVGVASRQPTAFRERIITELRLRGGGRMIQAGHHALRPALRVLAAREETLVFWMDDYIGGKVLASMLFIL